MEMCYNEALVMPSNYVVMDNEEMTYVDGGYELANSPAYLVKVACLAKATSLLWTGVVENMSSLSLAQEIYAHAVCYYASSAIKALGINSSMVDEINERGKIINIDNGGDTWKRRLAYAAIWGLNPVI